MDDRSYIDNVDRYKAPHAGRQCATHRSRYSTARQLDTTSWYALGNHRSAQAIFRSGDLFQAERRQRLGIPEDCIRVDKMVVVSLKA